MTAQREAGSGKRSPLMRPTPVIMPAAGDRLRPGGVQLARLAVQHLAQVRADLVEVDGLLGRRLAALDFTLLEEEERVALVERVPRRHGDAPDDAAGLRLDLVLHLHRFHDEQELARPHGVALVYLYSHDRALERRRHGDGAVRPSG